MAAATYGEGLLLEPLVEQCVACTHPRLQEKASKAARRIAT